MKKKEITLLEREEISILLFQNWTIKDIAYYLEKDESTIYREITRAQMNRYSYDPYRANKEARKLKKNQGRKKKITGNKELEQFVLEKLRLRWSPQEIAKELKKIYTKNKSMNISHETIYTYVYVLGRGSLKKELLSCLRQQKIYRRKKGKNQPRNDEKRGQIADMLSIEERPKEVEDRIIPGHWEGDLIIGKYKRSALGTLVERTTRATLLVPLKTKDAVAVRKAFARKVKKLPNEMRLSLTYDQGKEMTEHKLFTKQTKMIVYFAHPGSPWERGTNENTNGLIRQFFPKGTEFDKISNKEIKHVQDLLNGRPRRALDYRKPFEVFDELVSKINNQVAIET